jgi:glycosyltransferase involved in cell wall biosynthesis
MNDKRIKLSIIIPCYNEEATISQIIEKIIINSPFNNEIIVIDDCSTDKSKKILESNLKNKISKLIINEKNYGKGYSIRKGIEVCSGDIVLIQDADLEYDPSDYVRLVSPIVNGEGDVVYGSRFIGAEKRKVLYYWHSVGNKILTSFSNMLSNLNLTDMECCFKVFKSQLLKTIRLKENRFGFEPEITAKIAKLNINIYEVGVKYHGRKYSEGKKITWRDGLAAVKCILYYNLFDN